MQKNFILLHIPLILHPRVLINNIIVSVHLKGHENPKNNVATELVSKVFLQRVTLCAFLSAKSSLLNLKKKKNDV